jgi:hypothetical protein
LGTYAHKFHVCWIQVLTRSLPHWTRMQDCAWQGDQDIGQITHASIKPRQYFLYLKYSSFSCFYKMKNSINILPQLIVTVRSKRMNDSQSFGCIVAKPFPDRLQLHLYMTWWLRVVLRTVDLNHNLINAGRYDSGINFEQLLPNLVRVHETTWPQ